jgi:hypothetical protein
VIVLSVFEIRVLAQSWCRNEPDASVSPVTGVQQ